MAHPNEELARKATEALSKRDLEAFIGLHADDIVLHFPGRGPMAGDYRGKEGLSKLFEEQMKALDAPPQIQNHDILANDEHVVILNTVTGTRGGQSLEQNQVVVQHVKDGKIAETWIHFSKQQDMDEFTST